MVRHCPQCILESIKHGLNRHTPAVQLYCVNWIMVQVRGHENKSASRGFDQDETQHSLGRRPEQVQRQMADVLTLTIYDGLGGLKGIGFGLGVEKFGQV